MPRFSVFTMLHTLIHNVKTRLSKKDWLLPSLFFVVILFVLPFSLNDSSGLHLNIAHADVGFWASIRDGFLSGFWGLAAIIAEKLFGLAQLIFQFSGYLFTFAADFSTRGTTYADLVFINSIWTFIRDLINSLFIFVILYVAFKQLLSITDGFDQTTVKKTLVNIIIAALLINFSLFFTRAAVDVSNFLTRTLFCKMQTKDSTVSPPKIACDPAEVIAKGLDIQSFLAQDDTSNQANTAEKDNTDKRMHAAIAYSGATIAIIIASMAFFAIAFAFIIRILLLIVLLATSPIYFITRIVNFKGVSSLSGQWFNTLVGQLVFPVVLMLTLLVVAKFVDSPGFFPSKVHGGTFRSAIAGTGSDADFLLILNYGFVIFMLFFGLKTAKDLSGMAGSFGSKLSSMAMTATLATSGGLGRTIFGRMGGAIGQSKWAKGLSSAQAAEGAGFAGKSAAWARRFAGDKIIRGGKVAAEGSWDVRGTKAFEKTYGLAGKEFGVNAGKASTRSFAKNGREFAEYAPTGLRERMGIELSEDAKKRQAERVAAEVASRSYSGGAMLAHAQAELGDAFWSKENKGIRDKAIEQLKKENDGKPEQLAAQLGEKLGTKFKTEDEFKDTRVQLAKDIKKQYKDDPDVAEQKLSLHLGPEFTSGKEYKEVRAEILKDKKEKKVKDSAKDYGKASDEIEKLNKELADPNTPPARLQQLPAEIAKHKADKDKAEKDFTDSLKGTNANVVAELAVDDIGKLKQQLSKAHMAAIAKKMQEGSYSESDIAKLNALAREMLLDEKNENPELREWFANEIDKGTEGFVVDLLPDYKASMTAYQAAMNSGDLTAMAQEQGKMKQMLRGMRTAEVKDIPLTEILDPAMLEHVRPSAIVHQYKIASAKGDTAALSEMAMRATQLKQDPNFLRHLPKGARNKLIKALTGGQ